MNENNLKNNMIFTMPPEKWEHFLPLGNGRLGAMVKTHPLNEVIQLNEENIWSGGPIDRINPDSKKYLPKIQQLVKNGQVTQAQNLAFQTLSGTCCNERVYQTAGEFLVDFFPSKNFSSYKSILSLDESCVLVEFTDENNVKLTRKTWISANNDMIFIYITSDKKNHINFSGRLDRGIYCDNIFSKENSIFLEDSHGTPFCVGVGAVCDSGNIYTKGAMITGENCNQVLIFIDIQTWKFKKKITKKEFDKNIQHNYWSKNVQKKINDFKIFIQKNDFNEIVNKIYENHKNEYQTYWNNFNLQIGNENNNSSQKTVNELLQNINPQNTQLINLYANFSRYLLISGSRKPGILPLTLQGLWNCYMDPPWGSKYTININTQMNYWPVNIVGLEDCEIPLFNLLERCYENGKIVAKKMYGCRGYVIHHNTDFWGDCAPQDFWIPGTYWVLGAAWLSLHIFEHFEYNQNLTELEKYYYLMHEACLFFVDFLTPCEQIAEDGKPYLVCNPSVSPENSYFTKTGEIGSFCEGCQMDNMILYELFNDVLKSKKYLQGKCKNKKGFLYKTQDFEQFEYVLNHLKKPQLNSDGSLMEWNSEVTETEKGHRHISHLFGLFPGNSINLQNKQLINACKKTLENRLQNGGGHTGWSQAWIINFYVQLQEKSKTLDSILKILQNSTLPNLLDNHPPFQIDGNFGSLTGICRMLVKSKIDENGQIIVKLLPSLPNQNEWQNGKVRNMKIKGDYFVSFDWKNGKVENLSFVPGIFANKKAKIIVEDCI